ncbi:sugar-binding protein, partial [Bacteroidota bacterium]
MKRLTFLLFVLGIGLFIKSQSLDTALFKYSNSGSYIDGFNEAIWDSIAENAITYLIDGDNYPDSLDCSGFFKAFWHKDSLFIFVQAVDDSMSDASANPWENDGFEIYFDLDNSKDDQFTDDCYQFRFNINSQSITGRKGLNTWTPPTVDFVLAVEDNVRRLEVVFPLTKLGFQGDINNSLMGFDLQILDNDGNGREAALAWNDNNHEAWENPSKMGTIKFIGGTNSEPQDTTPSDSTTDIILSNSLAISIYPNPVISYFTVKANELINQITLYTLDGKVLLKSNNINKNVISMKTEGIGKGIY